MGRTIEPDNTRRRDWPTIFTPNIPYRPWEDIEGVGPGEGAWGSYTSGALEQDETGFFNANQMAYAAELGKAREEGRDTNDKEVRREIFNGLFPGGDFEAFDAKPGDPNFQTTDPSVKNPANVTFRDSEGKPITASPVVGSEYGRVSSSLPDRPYSGDSRVVGSDTSDTNEGIDRIGDDTYVFPGQNPLTKSFIDPFKDLQHYGNADIIRQAVENGSIPLDQLTDEQQKILKVGPYAEQPTDGTQQPTDDTQQPEETWGSNNLNRDQVLEGIADGSINPGNLQVTDYERLDISTADLEAIQEGYGSYAGGVDGTETEPLTSEQERKKNYILEGIRLGRIQPEDLDWQEGGELSELGIGKEELNEIVTKGLENGSIDLESLSEKDLELLDIDIPTGFRKVISDAVKGIKDLFRGIFGGVIDTIKDPLGTAEEVFQGAMGTSIGIKHDCEDPRGGCWTKLVVKIGVPIPGLTGEGLEIDLVNENGVFVFDDNARAKVNEVFEKLGDRVNEVQDKIDDAIAKLSKKTEEEGGKVESAEQDKDGNIIVKIIDAAGKAVKKILTPVEMIGELFGVSKGSSATGIGRGLGKILTVWGLGEILKKGKSGGSGSGTGTTPGTTTPGTGGSSGSTYDIFRKGRLNNLGDVLTSTYPGLLDLDDEQRQDIFDEVGNNLDEWDGLSDQEKKELIDGLIDDSTVYPDNRTDTDFDLNENGIPDNLEGGGTDDIFGTGTGTDRRDDNALVSDGGAAEALVSGGANNPFFSLLGDPESGGIFGEDETEIGDLEYFYNWASIFANPEQAKMYASARPTITNLLLDRLEKSQNNLNRLKRESNMLREPLTGININRGVV